MRPKILVVDDSKAVRILAAKALAPFACDVNEAANGYNGLFAMEKELPDLLLLDIVMPVMDGLEMLTLLKSHPDLKKIPVILLASPSDHQVMPKLAALGVSEHVMKPFKPDDLLSAVRRILDLKPLPAGA